jgi:hypothetical protein
MKLPMFKSTKMTKQVANVLIGLYLLYGFFNMPMSVLLLSAAIGMIILGTLDSMELAVAATLASGLLMRYVFKIGSAITHRTEGFAVAQRPLAQANQLVGEGFMTTDSKEVAARLASIRRSADVNKPLSTGTGIRSAALANGILSSTFSEGFADAATMEGGSASAEGTKTETATAPTSSSPSASSDSASAAPSAEKFADKGEGSDGLFKLGTVPGDSKSGPHLDAGSTLLNAISGLKPDQVKAMTEDTRKLLDTQKSLMGMLETMKPLLSDGQNLINTFGTMFGGKGGADGAMAAMAATGSK